jgi:hypothetical protein
MASIDSFRGVMLNGGVRANQFTASVTFPTLAGSVDSRSFSFLCKTAQLPASTIGDTPVAYRGKKIHFAGEREYAPWTVTVLVDNFDIRTAFEKWAEKLNAYAGTEGVITKADYQGTMEVQQLDRNDNTLKGYTFYSAFPTEIGAMQLDYDTDNTVSTFDVTFVYDYFLPKSGSGGGTA